MLNPRADGILVERKTGGRIGAYRSPEQAVGRRWVRKLRKLVRLGLDHFYLLKRVVRQSHPTTTLRDPDPGYSGKTDHRPREPFRHEGGRHRRSLRGMLSTHLMTMSDC